MPRRAICCWAQSDLTVAAAAQDAGIDILRFDQHLARLGDQLDVRSHWISDPS
jgi:hypothetical protein